MRKQLWRILVLSLALVLCACTGTGGAQSAVTLPTYEAPSTQPAPTEATTTPATQEPETNAPAHSELYLPEYSTQQIIEYFEEIVLHMEYADGEGNTALVQKWNRPITYRIFGEPTEEDLAVLEALFDGLNEIPGFPGIYAVTEEYECNLRISFLEPEAFTYEYSEFLQGEDAYGATRFWYYIDSNEIYTATIGYRTDIDQATRTSILLEEIVNMLGTSDTVLREDSVVYQYTNDNRALSNVDWLVLKLLYDPAIQCGMDAEGCRAVIQELYY